MARFKPKNNNEENNSNYNDENSVDTQLELLKYSTTVQSRIRDNITSDFTLCKLDQQDKEGITNMTVNAYVAKRKIKNIQKQSKWHKWNGKNWITEQPKEKQKIIKKLGEIAFDMYMTKVMMVAVLNRNVKNNHLVNVISQNQEIDTEEKEPTQTTEKKIKSRIIKKDENTKEQQI